MDHHTSLFQEKVIVHFDEAYGWRESFLRGLSSHTAKLFISSPGDIVSAERIWKWWFFACRRELCHHSGDLHRPGKHRFFWSSVWHLFNAPWTFIYNFCHLPMVRFAVTCIIDPSACHPPTACLLHGASYQMWLVSSSCMFWLLDWVLYICVLFLFFQPLTVKTICVSG